MDDLPDVFQTTAGPMSARKVSPATSDGRSVERRQSSEKEGANAEEREGINNASGREWGARVKEVGSARGKGEGGEGDSAGWEGGSRGEGTGEGRRGRGKGPGRGERERRGGMKRARPGGSLPAAPPAPPPTGLSPPRSGPTRAAGSAGSPGGCTGLGPPPPQPPRRRPPPPEARDPWHRRRPGGCC